MAWTPDTPQAAQFISVTQPLIEGNFQALDTWSQVDHSTIDSATPNANGYHYASTYFPLNGLAPHVFPANYTGFYSKTPTVPPLTTTNEIFCHFQNGDEKPITAARSPNLVAPNGLDGFGYLPGGALFKYNYILSPAAAVAQPYTYSTGGVAPAFVTVPLVFIQPLNTATVNIINILTSTALGFTYTLTDRTGLIQQGSFFFISIGV